VEGGEGEGEGRGGDVTQFIKLNFKADGWGQLACSRTFSKDMNKMASLGMKLLLI
jgi:hypothetical protein